MTAPSKSSSDAEIGARIALSMLSAMGPARLNWLLRASDAVGVLRDLANDRLTPSAGPSPRGVGRAMIERWGREARQLRPDAELDRHRSAGIDVLSPADEDWPFRNDPDPPILLYLAGDRSALPRPELGPPTLSIVGTRRCTAMGRSIARDFARSAAQAGVPVISGLALGIDGAAHEGALEVAGGGAPIAVVANGLDRISPSSHRRLADRVKDRGTILSESPLGTPGDRWRFPARNRLIAALSTVVLVIESHERGGALITVDEAIERGVTVAAVPGSIRSGASAGTNQLLADGAVPIGSWPALAQLLGCPAGPTVGRAVAPDRPVSGLGDSSPDRGVVDAILAEVAAGPMLLETLAGRVGIDLDALLVVVAGLVSTGALHQQGLSVSAVAT